MDLIGTKICMTKNLGVHGNMFGGDMMSFIDESAAAYACMYCDTPRMVTVKVSELVFKEPIKPGQMVRIYGEVESLGTTSITLHLVAKRHDPTTSEEVVTTTVSIKFVKIDENGKSTPLGERIQEKYKLRNTLK